MEVVVSHGNPQNVDEWNALCKECGNFVQTTMYSEITAFYGGKSIYVQVLDEDRLLGGVKLSWDVSRRLPFLLRRLSQFGEFVIKPTANIPEICQLLCNAISALVDELKPTVISVKGFYGGTELLYKTDKYKCEEKNYGVAYLDLTKSEDALYADMHVKHRNMINKAKRVGLVFEKIGCDSQLMNTMLSETYSTQDKSQPNPKYIDKQINVGEKYGVGRMYLCRCNKEILSCALVNEYGNVADYSFGGNRKNDCGAGQYLQYNICKDLKDNGIARYSLGQVAKNLDENNLKFSEGITRFKMRFGCSVVDASNRLYVVSPIANRVWNILCKLLIK